jgi:succinate-semialdehyde dehydrogenase/glutarate-semialdehyde dehydrogenase
MAYQSTNPCDGSVLATFDELDSAALKSRLHAAADCFEHDWRQRSYAERAVVLKRAATLMRERADKLARLVTVEMGKLLAQSAGEVALSAAILDYYADNGQAFLAPEVLTSPGTDSTIESCPVGVLLGVEP